MKHPTEHQEQVAVIQWARASEARDPRLELLHAIPNGGNRAIHVAKRLKDEGVKAGVPDLCLPVKSGKFSGLYLELKAQKGRKPTKEQAAMLSRLRDEGYWAGVCYGAEEAILTLKAYLALTEG